MAVDVPISQDDITFAKAFLTQFLEDKMPEADFSDGTALQDLVVKSMSYFFAFFRSELTKVKTLRSLAQLQALDEDEEVQEAVDDIISNFFINRGQGSRARLAATVVLSQQVDVSIGTSVSFNRDGTHLFFPTELTIINKENLIERITQQGETTYEFDIILEAENIGPEYEVEPGNFVNWDAFNPYVVSIRNDQKASGGTEQETHTEYIARSNEAITVRNLINPRSIRTVLLETFKDQSLKSVTTIGYGDPEMLRDIINTNVTFVTIDVAHIGNHQDIYVNLPIVEDVTTDFVTAEEVYLGEPNRNGAIQLPDFPIYRIHSVRDSITDEELPYHYYVRDHRYTYTAEQELFVVLNSGENGKAVTIQYDTVEGFDLIHAYLRNPDERITLANTLARAVIPIYVEARFNYLQIDGQPDLDEDAAVTLVVNYINALDNDDELDIDSLLKAIHAEFGQYIIIKNPNALKGTVIYPDRSEQEFYTENVLTVPEFRTLGITNRVCGYYTSAKYVSFTKID